MSPDSPQAAVIATELNRKYQSKPWFACIGVGEEKGKTVIFIYTRHKVPKKEKLPRSYKSLSVRVKLLGKSLPC